MTSCKYNLPGDAEDAPYAGVEPVCRVVTNAALPPGGDVTPVAVEDTAAPVPEVPVPPVV